MNELRDILSLTEGQAVALLELLPTIRHDAGMFHGLHLYMRQDDRLHIGSDGWPGEYVIDRSGETEYPE